ncbi:hypothetical protein GE21DRAFT_1291867 [Neurospora crassa]|nr:hypothetical protein GE21DRAFT_1291867 [Neurospora crassa]
MMPISTLRVPGQCPSSPPICSHHARRHRVSSQPWNQYISTLTALYYLTAPSSRTIFAALHRRFAHKFFVPSRQPRTPLKVHTPTL